MSERVRLELHELEDVKRIIGDYKYYVRDADLTNSHFYPQIEDLVNRIGEIYEKALGRKGQVTATR